MHINIININRITFKIEILLFFIIFILDDFFKFISILGKLISGELISGKLISGNLRGA
jgi:hypothetical protein